MPVTLAITSGQAVPDGLRCRATTRLDRHTFGVTAGRGLIGRYLDGELDVVSTVDEFSSRVHVVRSHLGGWDVLDAAR